MAVKTTSLEDGATETETNVVIVDGEASVAEASDNNNDKANDEANDEAGEEAGEDAQNEGEDEGDDEASASDSEGEESDSDAASEASIEYENDDIQQISRFPTSKIHEAYLMRLEAQKDKRKDSERAPNMIKGIIDYMKMLEDRIQALEPEAKQQEGGVVSTNDASVNEFGDIVHEIKFYYAKDEFTPEGVWKDNTLKKNSYQSRLDPNHLMRVLYNRAGGDAGQLGDGEHPDPDDINVLAFGVMSQPLSTFFSKKLGIEVEESPLHPLRFGKPFRPLLRHMQPLRDHLAKLEARYGTNEGDDGNSAEKKQDEAPAPFPVKEEPAIFETAEALIHFRFLVHFIDKYLPGPLERFRRVRAGLDDQIAYEDLWMLFDTGDTIYAPFVGGGYEFIDGTDNHISKARHLPQQFRVLGTKGGLPTSKILSPFQAERDEDVLENQRNRIMFTTLNVLCFNIDFDGLNYGAVRELFAFRPFDGLVDITSLEAYPVMYLKPRLARSLEPGGQTEEVDTYLERGRKFLSVSAVSHMSYEGLAIGQSREEINSAVVVDFKAAFQEYRTEFPDRNAIPQFQPLSQFWPAYEPGETYDIYETRCSHIWCHVTQDLIDPYYSSLQAQAKEIEQKVKTVLEDYKYGNLGRGEDFQRFKRRMEENDLVRLLPGVVPAFALRHRKWVTLDIDQLKELEQENDWDSLVLPPGHREMVQAMVETHSRGSQDTQSASLTQYGNISMDLVKGKGRGCIILLHGVPGVGKTSTAECVAAYTKRPLYAITCGDIGYLPEQVEDNMEQHFRLAGKWGCVLLLDEADVFLAKRNRTDVKRNGLVSVFLRILEYYSGILFLTTNRVGSIDDAFRSRLHLTLYYPKLTVKQTTKIWKNNFERLKDLNEERISKNQPPIEFDKRKILGWVKVNSKTMQWNGRQIRNAFQTAVSLAEFRARHETSPKRRKKGSAAKDTDVDNPLIDIEHFKLIARASIQFNDYLHDTLGDDEDELAARDQIRPLSFTPKSKLKDIEDEESSSTSFSEVDSGDEDGKAKDTDEDTSEESDDESSDGDSELDKRKKKKKAAKSKVKSSKKKKETKK